jgi:multidrug efflux pump subunit AcrB
MQNLIGGFVLAILAIYFLLAIPFRSYSQPLIVMIAIPFGIVGAVIGHLIMGYNLSVMSMMGIVALSGVVVNGSLILIDYANQQRSEGVNPLEAIRISGQRRFRPIILTTLTTFGGLAPMIFETSRQARFMIPMALSLGFGILFATVITLILVPCLYLMIEDIHQWMGHGELQEAELDTTTTH